jgi:hypothetical protein
MILLYIIKTFKNGYPAVFTSISFDSVSTAFRSNSLALSSDIPANRATRTHMIVCIVATSAQRYNVFLYAKPSG